ncbi:hypothetical protein DFQ07_2746 [Tenacibaculum caenipelagi]|uniref:Uncharacterized protein n=1 Tax=Tenacibaculum caenipelagi TaxID=1325435 RepID=A0A4R6TAZ2_9FLAO|nr:hypothetical protein DFQ07_2746 [Tenacibaculum caenipelagi]
MFEEWCIYKYQINDALAGFYILTKANLRTSILEFLFVAPTFFNQDIDSNYLNMQKHTVKMNLVLLYCII